MLFQREGNAVKHLIEQAINVKVSSVQGPVRYRTPLIGYADADDPVFNNLKQVAHQGHLLPRDLLPQARTVIAFFLPFDLELVRINRRHSYVSREWVQAYVYTNALISEICRDIAAIMAEQRFEAIYDQPTHNFDEEELLSPWSHKHVAFACGLGSFGTNTMLITERGCAGRFGSLVTDAEIRPVSSKKELFHPKCENCTYCIRVCPASALNERGLEKAACYRYLLEVNDFYNDLPLSDACGKCANGPCAIL